MADMMAFSVDDQENSERQELRSSGKRAMSGLQMNQGSAAKRRALACLSNHTDAMTGRQQLKSKATSSVFDHSYPPTVSLTHPSKHPSGILASPMLLSSPDLLTCSETVVVEDCSSCGDYSREIVAYLKGAEVRWQPKAEYMKRQPDITSGMRSVLVDWLVEVGDEFTLQPSTLYLAVSLLDRFLSLMSVVRGKLQLVGTTAMYVAAKLEEIYPPELADFSYITDNTYTQKQIVRMEWLMLQALDYHLLAPSSFSFLNYYLHLVSSPSLSVHHLAEYLCEMALLYSDPFLKYLPSEVASASLCLARHTHGQLPVWPTSLMSCTGYAVSDICHCLQDMHRMFAMASKQPQQAVRLKYSSEKFSRVAQLVVPETLPM